MSNEDLRDHTVHMIANAHIDPAWLWQWKEGRDEVFHTYRSALNLMKEFPQLAFSCSAAATYEWVEQGDPGMFDEIRQRVAEGRWEIVNGWWVQPDCNLPCGESFVRHSLYAKSYFRERFGVDVKTGYNVDSFGHCGTLPKLLKKAGFEHYVFFRPGPQEKRLPGNLFWWEADDGSRVLALRAPHHYGTWGEVDFAQRITDACRQWDAPVKDVACFFGVGNHGGGPTRENILQIIKLQQTPGMPQVKFSTLGKFFEAVLAQTTDYPVVHDDLQHHAVGCYTTVSEIKRQNREAEAALLAAERLAACASLAGMESRQKVLAQSWKKVLFNQFHDILAGSSIRPVYDDAAEDYAAVARDIRAVREEAIEKIGRNMDTQGEGLPLLLFNTLPWARTDAVVAELLLPDFNTKFKLLDADGAAMPVQVIDQTEQAWKCRTRVCFIAKMPALGCSLIRLVVGDEAPPQQPALRAWQGTIESRRFRLTVQPETGHVVSLFDKQAGVECLGGAACVPLVIDDKSDAWGHDVVEYSDVIGRFAGPASVAECGPVRAVITTRQAFGSSTIEQDFIIYNDLDRIDCEMRIDWHERHRMLKLSLPVNAVAPQATFEAPMGTIKRQPLGHEEPGQRWADLEGTSADGKHVGLLFINDSKYGYDFRGNELRMSVLRSPIYAYHDPRTVEPQKKYLYTDQGRQVVRYSLVPHAEDWRQADATRRADALCSPAIAADAKPHPGRWGRAVSFLSVSPENLIAEVLKRAEDANGFIVRVYETAGRDTEASIEMPAIGLAHKFAIGHNAIKTLRISGFSVTETDVLER